MLIQYTVDVCMTRPFVPFSDLVSVVDIGCDILWPFVCSELADLLNERWCLSVVVQLRDQTEFFSLLL